MNRLEVLVDDEVIGGPATVGTLTRTVGKAGETIDFEYAPEWLSPRAGLDAFSLDADLPLFKGRAYARAGANQFTGAFADSSPDRWGRRLMDRREAIEAREQGRKIRGLRAWDYLVGVNDESRMGALRLRDVDTGRFLDDRSLGAPPVTALRELEAVAAQIERGDADVSNDAIQWLKQLIAPGASLGGARPKASFRDVDGQLWLAKFPSNDDALDVGLWEFITHALATDAGVGIEMPPAKRLRLSDRGHTFAVKRFDRTPRARRMFSSAMTRIDADESDGHSYLEIVEAIEREGAPEGIKADLEQLYRRIAFGILVGNRDDHLRNHGFLRERGGWRLSPAFDVNPNVDKDHHVLAINEADTTPDTALLRATAAFYRLTPKRAAAIIDSIRVAVSGWESVARQHGAKGAEIERMRAVIDADR